MVSFTDHYNAIYIERLSSEIRKDSFLILLFYLSPNHFLQQRLFLVKTQKSNHPSTSDWRGKTKCSFKENARTSTAQEILKF